MVTVSGNLRHQGGMRSSIAEAQRPQQSIGAQIVSGGAVLVAHGASAGPCRRPVDAQRGGIVNIAGISVDRQQRRFLTDRILRVEIARHVHKRLAPEVRVGRTASAGEL